MKTRHFAILLLLFGTAILLACTPTAPPPGSGGGSGGGASTDTPESTTAPEPTNEDTTNEVSPESTLPSTNGDGSGGSSEGSGPCLPAAPQRLEFESEDGLKLVGTYYPPEKCGAPLALMMHQAGGDRVDWEDLALWMQNRNDETVGRSTVVLASYAAQYTWFPEMPENLSFGVFAFDFRDHGESASSGESFDAAGFLMDGRAALAFGKQLQGIDPTQVITIGASIGADASVDVCLVLDGVNIASNQVDQGCIGALPLSPGNFLNVDYVAAATRLGAAPHDVKIECIANLDDGNSPELCSSNIGPHHHGTVYPGNAHGVPMIQMDLTPDIGQVILDFLLNALGNS